jgi:hypothetical protein
MLNVVHEAGYNGNKGQEDADANYNEEPDGG